MSEHDPEPAPEARPSLFEAAAPAPPVHEPLLIDHAPPPPPVEPPRRRGGTPLPLTLLLTAALGGAGYWAWIHPMQGARPGPQPVDPQPAIDAARAQLAQQIQAVSDRVGALEKQPPQSGQPAAGAVDAGKIDALAARVDALEKQSAPAPAAGASAGDAAAALSKKLDDLSGGWMACPPGRTRSPPKPPSRPRSLPRRPPSRPSRRQTTPRRTCPT